MKPKRIALIIDDEKQIRRLLRLALERDDLRGVKLTVDDNQQTAGQYGVMSIPTMIVFKGGQPAKQIVGAYPKKKLVSEIEPVL